MDAPRIVTGEDGGAAADEALASERAAVWVGLAEGPEFEEFRRELQRGPGGRP